MRINNRELMADLRDKMPTASVYFRIKRIYDKYGPMSDEVVACVLADQIGLNLNRYDLAPETFPEVRRVKALIRESETETSKPVLKPASKTANKTQPKRPITVKITDKFTLTDAILPQARLNEAEMMSKDIYPFFYVLENSLRELILRVMDNAHGKNQWWNLTHIPQDIYDRVERRKANEKNEPWHGKRGENVHSIYYTGFLDLPTIIINKKNWPLFKSIVSNKESFFRRLKEISLSRNIVMHCNPLSERDKKRLEVYFDDWQNVLKESLNLIP